MAQRNAMTALLLRRGHLPCVVVPQDNCLRRPVYCSYLMDKGNVFYSRDSSIQAEWDKGVRPWHFSCQRSHHCDKCCVTLTPAYL